MEPTVMTGDEGFTLIEFLVATVILMVGLLGMLAGIDMAMRRNIENNLRNEGVHVADDVMLASRARSFVSLSTTVTNPAWKLVPQSEKRYVTGIYKNYSVQQIITEKTSQSKEIIVNVAWKYRNVRNSHSVSSIVSLAR